MDRRQFLTAMAGAGLATLLPATAEAATWLALGTRKVNGLLDADRIHVGSGWGKFRRIRLRIRGNDLFLHRVVVRFENGGEQRVNVNRFYPQGSYTAALDLDGDKRFIRHVSFVYGKFPNGQGATFIDLQGRR